MFLDSVTSRRLIIAAASCVRVADTEGSSEQRDGSHLATSDMIKKDPEDKKGPSENGRDEDGMTVKVPKHLIL